MKLFSHAKTTQPADHLLPGEVPSVTYPDATALDRPTHHSWKHRGIIALAVLGGMLVAAGIGTFAYHKIVTEPDTELARTIEALEADADYRFPNLLEVVDLSDAEMEIAFRQDGNTLVFMEPYPEDPEESEGFDLWRLAETVDEKTGTDYLEDGIASLKRSQAATFLKGSWRFTVWRYLTVSARLQYADFAVTDPGHAIAHAMELQGWLTDDAIKALQKNFDITVVLLEAEDTPAEGSEGEEVIEDEASEDAGEGAEPEQETSPIIVVMGDHGVDTNGNTYQTGTLILDDQHYEFRISTVTVQEMYGLNLPRDGMFLGIRVTRIILAEE